MLATKSKLSVLFKNLSTLGFLRMAACSPKVFLVVLYFHFQIYEMIPILICIFLVLSAEIINTVVEDVCDKIEPQHDRIIGKIKDMMAAYVLVTVLGSVVVGVLVFYSHFYYQIFVS